MNSRNTFLEINLNNYVKNISFFKEKIFPRKIISVVKADAYGHGAVEISKAANNSGVYNFVVAFFEEAIELKDNGIVGEILILNYFNPKYINEIVDRGISVTLFSESQLKEWTSFLKEENKQLLKIHLNIDTGMNVLGIKIDEAYEIIENLYENGYCLEGIYSHYTNADIIDSKFYKKQKEEFSAFVEKVSSKHSMKYIHISNSAASISNNIDENYVRLGIYSYGLQAIPEIFLGEINPVMSFKSIISDLKKIKKSDTVGYGRTFTARRSMNLASIPVGYADGYDRKFSNNGDVLIKGKKCPIVGRICMDQFVVNISDINEKVSIGDEVVLFGNQKNEEIKVENLAERINTLNYEIISRISKRVERRYINIK